MNPTPLISVIALSGAILILTIFALMDFYAVSQCFALANTGITAIDLCAPEHIFRTALEIGGMAIGLYGVYGVAKVLGRGHE
jgi:hypothetical protein